MPGRRIPSRKTHNLCIAMLVRLQMGKAFGFAIRSGCLTTSRAENGATRVVPGSHRWSKLPQEVLSNPIEPHPEEVLLLGKAGSVVVMNTHAWHGGTANRTGESTACAACVLLQER